MCSKKSRRRFHYTLAHEFIALAIAYPIKISAPNAAIAQIYPRALIYFNLYKTPRKPLTTSSGIRSSIDIPTRQQR